MDTLSMIHQNKIVAIARKVAVSDIVDTVRSLFDGGIRCIEITFDQASRTCMTDTCESIEAVKKAFGDVMCIGAGTVLNVEQVKGAVSSGADFILAPNTDVAVIAEVKRLGLIAVPGAFSPTEIMTAWNAGADIVKIFPVDALGVSYIKSIRGPISHIPLMAVGGVTVDNIKIFLDNSFCSCGIGSNIVRNDLIAAGKFNELTELAKTFMQAI